MNTSRIIRAIGALLFLLGAYEGWQVRNFTSLAIEVLGTVTTIEERRGPPKPRQKTPLHVLYRLPNGTEMSAVTHLPMLQQIKQGDSIRLLADPRTPGVVRLPLWSELWARALTYCIGGLLLVVVAQVLGTKHSR